MCNGQMMMKKELFEKYFKLDFVSMATDRVPNVRIAMAKVVRHHFLKEINGSFVNDKDLNDAVRLLKIDVCPDVRLQVHDIETYAADETNDVTVESFKTSLNESRMSLRGGSDSGSITSEDDLKIEMEISRHNSEDEIDHGPVLKSLRKQR